MILQTNLKHVASKSDFSELIENNKNVMICCGRMGPMCLPVYDSMEELESKSEYSHITFSDMLFDNPDAVVIRNLEACRSFMGLPFTVYFKDGELVKATSSIQSMDQITTILDSEFSK